MKKLILFGLAFLVATSSYSQADYTFSQSTAAYAQISGASKISPDLYLSGQDVFAYQLPFPIRVKDITAETFVVNSYGDIMLAAHGNNWGIWVTAFSAGLADYEGDGGVYSTLTGTTGNRILRLEFRNLETVTGHADSMDVVNYQVAFFEADSSIEIKYNNSELFKPEAYISGKGPVAGIFDIDQAQGTFNTSYYLTDDPTAATFHSDAPSGTASTTMPSFLVNIPKNTVYRFKLKADNTATSITNPNEANLAVYPNPVYGNTLFVNFNNAQNLPVQVAIYSLDGKLISEQVTLKSSEEILINEINPGIYLVKITGETFTATQKIIVE